MAVNPESGALLERPGQSCEVITHLLQHSSGVDTTADQMILRAVDCRQRGGQVGVRCTAGHRRDGRGNSGSGDGHRDGNVVSHRPLVLGGQIRLSGVGVVHSGGHWQVRHQNGRHRGHQCGRRRDGRLTVRNRHLDGHVAYVDSQHARGRRRPGELDGAGGEDSGSVVHRHRSQLHVRIRLEPSADHLGEHGAVAEIPFPGFRIVYPGRHERSNGS